jgi:putative phage-type endonuclease
MIQQINHVERRQRLHATDVPAILGLSPKTTAREVQLNKQGRLEPWNGNDATEAGSILEPSIVALAERELGPLERQPLCIAENVGFPLAATPDGRVIATNETLDAKTSGITGPIYGRWGDEGGDEVPDYYLVQVSVQMICTGAKLAHVYALLGGRGIVRYRIPRDEEVIAAIVARCKDWWRNHIELGIDCESTEPLPLEVVKRLRREPNKIIELPADAESAVAHFEAIKASKSTATKAYEAAQSRLIEMLGDAEAGRLPDGRILGYPLRQRKGYTVADCEYRQLTIKKG